MKFSVKEKPLAVAPPPAPMTVEQVNTAYEDLMCSYMELSDAQRNLDEVCQVMENIQLSMKMIKTGGMDAVKLLNIDKSLEGLLGVAEEKLKVEAVQEGFAESAKVALQKFWAFIKEAIRKIIAWIKMVFQVGIGWDGRDLADLKKRVDSIDVVMDNAFQMRSNLFGGILTLKAYTEIPDKIEKFLGCATQVCEQTEKVLNTYSSRMEVQLGGKTDSVERFKELSDEFRARMGEISKYMHDRTRSIFGKVGNDVNVGWFSFNFKLGNFILESSRDYTKGQIFSCSLKECGFSDKSAFQQAFAGFEKLNNTFTKGPLSKIVKDVEKLGTEILGIQKIEEGMRAGLGEIGGLSNPDDRAIFKMNSTIHEDIKACYKVIATATSWIADAKSIKNAMDNQFRIMMKAAFSASSHI